MGASCSTNAEGTVSAPEKKGELYIPPVKGSVPKDATIIFVLGGPGAGKGTQCDKIKAKYAGVVHLSAGDLLRDEVKSGSEAGKKLDETMKEGKLVPMAVTITLLNNAMIKSGGSLFLIDGFPRATDQAQAFEKNILKAKAAIFFETTEAEMEARLLKRGETSGRADDNAETIKKRFKTFVEQSLPVKDYLKERCYSIDASPTPDEIFVEVVKVLDPIINKAKEEPKKKKKEEEEEEEEEKEEEKEKEEKQEEEDGGNQADKYKVDDEKRSEKGDDDAGAGGDDDGAGGGLLGGDDDN